MKRIFTLLFLVFAFTSQAQDCNKTCEVEKEIGQGVFLGVQIHSHKDKPGVHVVEVIEGTQAEKMGILKGDKIFTVNGVEMKDTPFMVEWVGKQYAGMPVSIEMVRNDKSMTLTGELGYKTMETVMETICCDKEVGKLKLADLKAYPNPSRGEFTLSFAADNDSPIDMTIVDLNGNIIFENTIYPSGGFVNERVLVNAGVAGDHIMVLSQNGKTTEKKLIFVK